MSTPPTRIASVPPPFPDDPYLALFYSALDAHGFALEAPSGRYDLAWFRSRGRSVDAFHFHWLHLFYDRPGTWRPFLGFTWLVLRLLALRFLGYGIIWTVHNLHSHEKKHPLYDRLAGRLMARLAHVVFAHGELAAREVGRTFGRADVVQLPLFSQVGHYPDTLDRATARERLGLPADAFVILSLGKIRAYKGADRLVELFSARGHANDRLLVAGRPETPAIETTMQSLAAKDPRITLHARFIPDDEVQLYYRAADVAVFPYRDILTAGAVGVALAFGVPLVAPRRGSLPEAIGEHAGVLYDPDDPEGLWRAVEAVRAADRVAMASAARARASELSFPNVARVAAGALRERL